MNNTDQDLPVTALYPSPRAPLKVSPPTSVLASPRDLSYPTRSSAKSDPSAVCSNVELLRSLRAGNAQALSILYQRYARLVYGLALGVLGNAQEAEDLTQEVFLALWQRDLYDPQRGSLSSFLIMLTRSRGIDRLRSRNSQTKSLQRLVGLLVAQPTWDTPLEKALLEERSQHLLQALAQLPEAERQVLETAYFEGLSQSEIATKLNIPLGTIKTRCRQGLLKLRQSLQHLNTCADCE